MLDPSDPIYRFYIPIAVVGVILLSIIIALNCCGCRHRRPRAPTTEELQSERSLLAEDDDGRSQGRRHRASFVAFIPTLFYRAREQKKVD
ncbi:MAG: hypothetical protein Q9210_002056 [Variospora velana]